MHITIGTDHAGYKHKDYLVQLMGTLGHTVSDVGGCQGQSTDYPLIAIKAAQHVAAGKADLGILLCGTGIGVSIAANKVKGIRAALCWNRETALLARKHNNANMICMGARLLGEKTCGEMIKAFLSEPFSKQERHHRRVNQISNIEERNCAGDDHKQ